MDTNTPQLVYWAGNSMPYSLLDRAEGAAAAGWSTVSCFVGDLLDLERSGTPLRSVRARLEELGVELNTLDPYLAWYPGYDPAAPVGVAVKYGAPHLGATEADLLRWAAELGATYVSTVAPFDDPSGQFENPADASFEEVVDSLGRFADAAATAGLRPHLEPIPTTKVADLDMALALVNAVGRENLGLLLDTYNLGRAGLAPAELDQVPRELIFQIQIADAKRQAVGDNYFDDGFSSRLFAGDGELEAVEMMRRIAAKGPLPPSGPEVVSERMDALDPATAAAESLAATRRLLEEIG
ncbi:MAG: sugar phosphate isomerase/epimerase, partial [Actinobacteria bacterium]|nr:sugar phosphate isomerase/epimerase [Actinomycetota bacterium]